MGKKIISFLSDGILSGIFLCVGCCVSMSVESKPLGAFLFSLGLCAIIVFKFGLFTGKAGYMAVKALSYVPEVVLTFIGNATLHVWKRLYRKRPLLSRQQSSPIHRLVYLYWRCSAVY